MGRPGGYLAATLLSGVLFALPACAPETKEGVTAVPPCGKSRLQGMLVSNQYPAVDEGEGRVGLMYFGSTDEINFTGPLGYYRLYSCQSRSAVGFDSYGIENPRDDVPYVGMEEFLQEARRRGLMKTPEKLVQTALRQPGFKPVGYAWYQPAMDEYATCACQHFYPDLAPAAAKGKQ